MTQDEIIDRDEVLKMARQAGGSVDDSTIIMFHSELEAFAKLVADAAAAKEREACMELCEDADSYYAIRARGEIT